MTAERCVCSHVDHDDDPALYWPRCTTPGCPCDNWFSDEIATLYPDNPLTDAERATLSTMDHGERIAYFMAREHTPAGRRA